MNEINFVRARFVYVKKIMIAFYLRIHPSDKNRVIDSIFKTEGY